MAHSANDNAPVPGSAHHDEGERPFDRLPFAGQLLVWGIRNWVTALKREGDFAALTGDAFERFGLGTASQSLDELFQLIAVSATRQIDIRCVKCRQISEDEALLLDCIAAAQEDRLPLAYAGILEILPPAAARHAMPTLISLAKIIAHAGLTLTLDKPVLVQADALAPAADLVRPEKRQVAQQPTKPLSLIDQAAAKLLHMDVPALVH